MIDDIDNFVKAIIRVDMEPCTLYGCDKIKLCKEKKLACNAFAIYVRTGLSRDPKTVFPKRMLSLSNLDDQHVQPAPTAGIYRKSMAT